MAGNSRPPTAGGPSAAAVSGSQGRTNFALGAAYNFRMQIVLGIGEIRGMFDRLIRRDEPREEVAQFASTLLHKLDDGDLRYLEAADASRIRKALLFLTQADLLGDNHEYLFPLQEFIDERERLRL